MLFKDADDINDKRIRYALSHNELSEVRSFLCVCCVIKRYIVSISFIENASIHPHVERF